jgi:membrane-associated phospholipid phosphatase
MSSTRREANLPPPQPASSSLQPAEEETNNKQATMNDDLERGGNGVYHHLRGGGKDNNNGGGKAGPEAEEDEEEVDEEIGRSGWQPRVRHSLEKYRWAEVAMSLIILLLAYKGFGRSSHRRQYVPQVTQVLPGGATVVLANNPSFSYPLRFDGGRLECMPSTLEACRTDLSDPCCGFVKTGEGPYQTISVLMLGMLAFLLPVLLMVLRHALYQRYVKNGGSSSSSSSSSIGNGKGNGSALASLRDVLVGFLFNIAMTQGVTNSLKTFVSAPRPNHYALLAYASLTSSASKAKHYENGAWVSWPSGHCSFSMAAGVFVALLFLHDIKTLTPLYRLQREVRAVLVFVAMAPVYLALFIAATRITNYFHSTADAIAGMVIGLICALVSHHHVIPANPVRVRPNKSLTYF